MVKKRMKAAAIDVPQTMEDAISRLARFAELEANLEQLSIATAAEKAEIDAARDSLAAPIIAELKAITSQMKPFWEARRQEITGGKRKSVILGGCEIGTRLGNPTLGYPKGQEEELVEELDALGFREWALREVLELDKTAIVKALRPETDNPLDLADAKVLEGLGFAVRQTETFFITRAASEPAEAATVGKEAA